MQYLETPEQDDYRDDIEVQARIITEAYADFETHINKQLGLSSRTTNMEFVAYTLLSALDDISNKVRKLKSKVADAVAVLGLIPAFEIWQIIIFKPFFISY